MKYFKFAIGAFLVAFLLSIRLGAETNQVDAVEVEELDEASLSEEVQVLQLGSSETSRTVSFLEEKLTLDIYEAPHIGSPEAEHVILQIFDYTCAHCRAFHQIVRGALDRYGNKLAVVCLPVPMESYCNPFVRFDQPRHQYACQYAKYSMAVCAHDPGAFPAFHDWMMEGKKVMPFRKARVEAEKTIGKDQFIERLIDPLIDDWISFGVSVYQYAEGGGIPKVILGTNIVTIGSTTPEDVYELLETNLDIQPVTEE